MTAADEDAAVAGDKWVDMAGSGEIGGDGVVGDAALDGSGAVGGGDSGGDAELGCGVDGDGEGGSKLGCVFLCLGGKFELCAAGLGHGDAERAAAVSEHEVYGFGCGEFGCADEIAFVFAVFVVAEDDQLTLAEVGEDVVDLAEGCVFGGSGGCSVEHASTPGAAGRRCWWLLRPRNLVRR